MQHVVKRKTWTQWFKYVNGNFNNQHDPVSSAYTRQLFFSILCFERFLKVCHRDLSN